MYLFLLISSRVLGIRWPLLVCFAIGSFHVHGPNFSLFLSSYPSDCLHVTARFPGDGFLCDLILGTYLKICLKWGGRYRVLYTKHKVRFTIAGCIKVH
jgi:hypothetical protein